MNYTCYTDDWKRTQPDRVLYLPQQPCGTDGDNEHLHIIYTPHAGDMLAFWTMGAYESSPDSRTVFSRSRDGGLNWSSPEVMTGTTGPILSGRWGFPVLSRTGRIYYFFNKNIGLWDVSYSVEGTMHCVYSDDDGYTWKDGGDIPFRRRPGYSHPDPAVPCAWIVWQPLIRDKEGRQIAAFTRWSSLVFYPKPVNGRYHFDTRSELMRFDNIDEGPDPQNLKITWLPDGDSISVPCPVEPEKSKGYSLAEEPAAALLPDGRLFTVMRTLTGHIWYTVSENSGESWRPTEILCRYDGGPEMLHPKSPCPLYRLSDGRYLLFFHNHDGTGYGAHGPQDNDARRPIFMSVGEFRPGAHQPVWFSEPKLLFDTDGVALGPGNGAIEGGRTWLALYGCLTERNGERILWYPDRKHFLLGRCITDEMLVDMTVPFAK